MIVDIANELITDITNGLSEEITVLSAYQSTTPNFPTVIVSETDNSDDKFTTDTGGVKYNNISFVIEIYTIGPGRLSEAKKIRYDVDKIISKKYGLTRSSTGAIPNYADENIYRYRLMYTGKIDKRKVIYRG